jgi:membrane fusion protein (multidrug efflux system)
MTPERRKKIFMIVGPIVLFILGFFAWKQYAEVSTDNATVQASTVILAAKVSGYIQKVSVDENQSVKAQQVLAEIDARDYENTLNQTQSEVQSLEARFKDTEKNHNRNTMLLSKGAISQQAFDATRAAYVEVGAKLKAAQAQAEQAKLNLENTKIRAPFDGIIAKKAAEVGMLAAPGQALFGIVSDEKRWIVANFKETEIKNLTVGQSCLVQVDSIPGSGFHGRIESLAPSTGAVFSLLPPDNATGNFTKVVQRVPVRISLDNLNADDIRNLKVGLSAEVSVRVH